MPDYTFALTAIITRPAGRPEDAADAAVMAVMDMFQLGKECGFTLLDSNGWVSCSRVTQRDDGRMEWHEQHTVLLPEPEKPAAADDLAGKLDRVLSRIETLERAIASKLMAPEPEPEPESAPANWRGGIDPQVGIKKGQKCMHGNKYVMPGWYGKGTGHCRRCGAKVIKTNGKRPRWAAASSTAGRYFIIHGEVRPRSKAKSKKAKRGNRK